MVFFNYLNINIPILIDFDPILVYFCLLNNLIMDN